ncbi:competence protein ComK [Niallia sp. Krafla_26]|uniref:competence protein ComK n=1 Tax=Niallia sp. Krafla_26 TaxID=3064703 RepID=UPI003D172FED
MNAETFLSQYFINKDTSCISSHFVNGHEFAVVMEGNQRKLVKQSPDEIVEESFHYTVQDLVGATKSARKILKRSYKQVPVPFAPEKSIMLIRCPSIDRFGCHWLVHSKIIDIHPKGKKQTTAEMVNGHFLTVNLSFRQLHTQRMEASFVREMILLRGEMQPYIFSLQSL